MLQSIIDKINQEKGQNWIIVPPGPLGPPDLCIFRETRTHKQARREIPSFWFETNEIVAIEGAVRSALQLAFME